MVHLFRLRVILHDDLPLQQLEETLVMFIVLLPLTIDLVVVILNILEEILVLQVTLDQVAVAAVEALEPLEAVAAEAEDVNNQQLKEYI